MVDDPALGQQDKSLVGLGKLDHAQHDAVLAGGVGGSFAGVVVLPDLILLPAASQTMLPAARREGSVVSSDIR
jgi:hypothetical protein